MTRLMIAKGMEAGLDDVFELLSGIPKTLSWLMLGAAKRCVDQNLEDLKAFIESRGEIRLCGEGDS